MSVATEISRLQTARNTLRTKGVALGICSSTDKIDDIATAFDGITNQGAVTATVQEGATYTIPAGFHNGSGTVSGVAGGGSYSLQAKGPITPSTSQQSISPDSGYYGLSSVTIDPIPSNYADVSSTTAAAADVLANKIFVDDEGTPTAGAMTNNGAVSKTLDATSNNQSYTVPAGYHNGSGAVGIVLEEKSATPSGSSQDITPTSGKVLSKVTVGAIPAKYADTTGDDGAAADVLYGKKVHSISSGSAVAVVGTMPNQGTVTATIDGITTSSYTIPAGKHSGSGTVSLTNDIETALAAI